MTSEHEICRRYEAELATIAPLDRGYYVTSRPTHSERAAFAVRQARLEDTRIRFYAELTACRQQRLLRLLPLIRQSHVQRRFV